MADDWTTYTLGEVTDNFDAIRVPVKASDRRAGPYPYYGASGIVDFVDTYLFDGEYLLIGEDGENLRTRKTPVAFLARGKFWVNNHAHIVRGNDLANTRFLAAILENTDISGYTSGSTMPKLTQGNMNRIRLLLPPRHVQDAIASLLQSLDDKIELNRRMNETLEAMARTLFKSWFIDFDPVRAKADGRKPEGMDEATARLFPDSFAESKLGKIPSGWKAESLESHFEAVKGLSYKGSGLTDSGMPLHNLNSVLEGGGYKYAGIKFYNGEFRERHRLIPGDVIVTNTEQGFGYLLIGYPAIVPSRFGEEGLFSHHIFRLRSLPHSPLTNTMAYLWLRYDSRLRDEVTGYSNGTTVNMLSVEGLKRPLIPVPSQPIIGRFESAIRPMLQLVESNVEASTILAATRDSLLPKLLSGELRIKDTERFVEARR